MSLYVAGRMALAGLDPDRTRLDVWVAAAFAALVDIPRDSETLEKTLAALSEPLPLEERTDLDPDTWGASQEAQEAQQRLIAQFGG